MELYPQDAAKLSSVLSLSIEAENPMERDFEQSEEIDYVLIFSVSGDSKVFKSYRRWQEREDSLVDMGNGVVGV